MSNGTCSLMTRSVGAGPARPLGPQVVPRDSPVMPAKVLGCPVVRRL
jgi:hypothetical protein